MRQSIAYVLRFSLSLCSLHTLNNVIIYAPILCVCAPTKWLTYVRHPYYIFCCWCCFSIASLVSASARDNELWKGQFEPNECLNLCHKQEWNSFKFSVSFAVSLFLTNTVGECICVGRISEMLKCFFGPLLIPLQHLQQIKHLRIDVKACPGYFSYL